MQTLTQKLFETQNFLYGVELVSIRGSMSEERAVKARHFANQLVDHSAIDWISITDNAGGNPQLAPEVLAKPILYAGKEVVIHMTCKDLNRNGLESQAWALNSEGFHNILAMTGDYPVSGDEGMAKPVFDIDSVGLIAMLEKMNHGFNYATKNNINNSLNKTAFLIGAVTTNFKYWEGEVIPQYLKLQKKVECGARFIINQIGYDSRKIHELRLYMDNHNMNDKPLIGNVYVLSGFVSKLFYDRKIPGVIVTEELYNRCLKHAKSPDKGRAYFNELAAKQIAIYKGLGYRGCYLGGVHDLQSIDEVLHIEKSFSGDDWKEFAKEIRFSKPGEFYFYGEDDETKLADNKVINSKSGQYKSPAHRISYAISKWTHDNIFENGTMLANLFKKTCAKSKNPAQGPKMLRFTEKLSKAVLFDCKDCGDCSLPEIAFLCPESQCAKNQRNGPCGGTNDGKCEVAAFGDCIWLRAYERKKKDGNDIQVMLDHAPVIQNQELRNTSAWANNWLGKDHIAKKNKKKKI